MYTKVYQTPPAQAVRQDENDLLDHSDDDGDTSEDSDQSYTVASSRGSSPSSDNSEVIDFLSEALSDISRIERVQAEHARSICFLLDNFKTVQSDNFISVDNYIASFPEGELDAQGLNSLKEASSSFRSSTYASIISLEQKIGSIKHLYHESISARAAALDGGRQNLSQTSVGKRSYANMSSSQEDRHSDEGSLSDDNDGGDNGSDSRPRKRSRLEYTNQRADVNRTSR